MTTRVGVKRQNAHTSALPCRDLAKSRSEVAAGHQCNLRAFPFMRRVLLLLFLTSLITESSQRCFNQFLSFHQSCIRSLRATTIVSANSHLADYGWEAGGLFNRSAT